MLTVNSVIRMVVPAATKNTHQLILIRKTKSCSHACIANHPMGIAMISEMNTSEIKSFASSCTMLVTVAPRTFLIPISFVFTWAVYAARPNKPRHEIKIATIAKILNSLPVRCSVL